MHLHMYCKYQTVSWENKNENHIFLSEERKCRKWQVLERSSERQSPDRYADALQQRGRFNKQTPQQRARLTIARRRAVERDLDRSLALPQSQRCPPRSPSTGPRLTAMLPIFRLTAYICPSITLLSFTFNADIYMHVCIYVRMNACDCVCICVYI